MLLAIVFLVTAAVASIFVLVVLVPPRSRSKRSKETALSLGSTPSSLAKDGSAGRSTRRCTPAGLMAVQVGRHGSYSEEGECSQPTRECLDIESEAFIAAMNAPSPDDAPPAGEVQTHGLQPRYSDEPSDGQINAMTDEQFVQRFGPSPLEAVVHAQLDESMSDATTIDYEPIAPTTAEDSPGVDSDVSHDPGSHGGHSDGGGSSGGWE